MTTTTTTKPAPQKERRLRLASLIRQDKELPTPARSIIGPYIAGLCDGLQPYAFASQADMAERHAMSERAVRRAVKDLVDRGYFTRERAGTSRGDGWGRNRYHAVWGVLTDPTLLKTPAKATGRNRPEPNADGSSGTAVARPKVAGGHRREVAGAIGQEWPVKAAESGRCIIEGNLEVSQAEGQHENCAAGRTVPVGAGAWDNFLSTFPGRVGHHHNGGTDIEWKPIFDHFLDERGLPWIKRRASLDQARVGRPLCSVGHFLHNLEASV